MQNQLFQTSYQKNTDNFSSTFNLNTQHQGNISTSICKVGGETKSYLPPITVNESYPPSLPLSSRKSLEYRGWFSGRVLDVSSDAKAWLGQWDWIIPAQDEDLLKGACAVSLLRIGSFTLCIWNFSGVLNLHWNCKEQRCLLQAQLSLTKYSSSPK